MVTGRDFVLTVYRTLDLTRVQWMDPSRRGYLKMSFTAAAAKGEWVFIDTVSSGTYSVASPAASEVRSYLA